MAKLHKAMAVAVGGAAALVLGMLVVSSWRGSRTALDEPLWSPRGYGFRPQYYGEVMQMEGTRTGKGRKTRREGGKRVIGR
eukprot:745829-Hanusia_phi.AAC.3